MMSAIKVQQIDGEKLNRLRCDRFLTRKELAKMANTHRDHLGRLERGVITTPRMETIRSLASALGVDPSQLLKD